MYEQLINSFKMDRHCINYSVGQFISVTQIIYLINFCLINEYKWDLTVVFIRSSINSTCAVLSRIKQTWYSNVDQKMVAYWFMTRVTIVPLVNDIHIYTHVTMVLGFWWPWNITIDVWLIRFHWSLLMLKFHCITRVLDSIEDFPCYIYISAKLLTRD